LSKKAHTFYIVIIVLLLLANVVLYLGKDGRFNAVANMGKPLPISTKAEDSYINLNTATQAELMTVDGIGPATAQKIIRRREELGGFRRVEDLLSVEDIGEGKFEKFKEHFYVE